MKKFKLFLPFLALIVAGIACAGSTPITLNDITTINGASALQTGDNEMADILVSSMSESMTQESVDTNHRMFLLPEGTSWQAVKDHYSGQAGEDWTAETDLSEDTESFKSIGWSRGPAGSEQVLLIAYAVDPFTDSLILLEFLFSDPGVIE